MSDEKSEKSVLLFEIWRLLLEQMSKTLCESEVTLTGKTRAELQKRTLDLYGIVVPYFGEHKLSTASALGSMLALTTGLVAKLLAELNGEDVQSPDCGQEDCPAHGHNHEKKVPEFDVDQLTEILENLGGPKQ